MSRGAFRPPSGRPLSSPHLLAVPVFALVPVGPDVDAFTGGVVLGISAAFVVLVALGGLSVVRRILGS